MGDQCFGGRDFAAQAVMVNGGDRMLYASDPGKTGAVPARAGLSDRPGELLR
jgi:hypothetical protein